MGVGEDALEGAPRLSASHARVAVSQGISEGIGGLLVNRGSVMSMLFIMDSTHCIDFRRW